METQLEMNGAVWDAMSMTYDLLHSADNWSEQVLAEMVQIFNANGLSIVPNNERSN
jgi:hypothetical protein